MAAFSRLKCSHAHSYVTVNIVVQLSSKTPSCSYTNLTAQRKLWGGNNNDGAQDISGGEWLLWTVSLYVYGCVGEHGKINIRSRLILSGDFNNYIKQYSASCVKVPFHHLKSVKNCEPSKDHTEHINGHSKAIWVITSPVKCLQFPSSGHISSHPYSSCKLSVVLFDLNRPGLAG